MICSNCGGQVIWQGPASALTHTECQNCGGINCQKAEAQTCPDCNGAGGHTVPVCCQRPLPSGECCGDPEPDLEPCSGCGGSGVVPEWRMT